MPNFRLYDHQVQTISAYLWQAGLADPLPKQNPGNAAHGKKLFETRGCLACHSMGKATRQQGGTFAANLTREGERPTTTISSAGSITRESARVHIVLMKRRTLDPKTTRRRACLNGFDLEHSKCPNDGHELQVQNMTVMPSLRQSPEDAQDIATYLVSQEASASSYAQASFMEDPELKEEGKKWIRHYGCAGCHEISGFEDEGRIGTELTYEGSKPIERLDFALFTEVAQRGGRIRTDHRSGRPGTAAKVRQENRGTTTKDSSSTNWPSRTSTTRAR